MKQCVILLMIVLGEVLMPYGFSENVPANSQVLSASEKQKKEFRVHPWGMYLFTGLISDAHYNVAAINIEAVNSSHEAKHLKLINYGEWHGFLDDDLRFYYRIYKQFPLDFYVLFVEYDFIDGHGSLGHPLLVQKKQYSFYYNGKKEVIHTLMLKGSFVSGTANDVITSVAEKIISKLTGQDKAVNQPPQGTFAVHPWGIYLICGDFVNARSNVIAIDINAVKSSNEIVNLKLIQDEEWRGFLDQGLRFKYRIYKKLPNHFYVLHCILTNKDNKTFERYLLVKKGMHTFYEEDKQTERPILECRGFFDQQPSDKELNKIISELEIIPVKKQFVNPGNNKKQKNENNKN